MKDIIRYSTMPVDLIKHETSKINVYITESIGICIIFVSFNEVNASLLILVLAF